MLHLRPTERVIGLHPVEDVGPPPPAAMKAVSLVFGLGGSRILIRTRRDVHGVTRAGQREITVKGRPDPLAARVAAFLRDLPIQRGTIRIQRLRNGRARLTFSRDIDESLAQRVRNYACSLSSR